MITRAQALALRRLACGACALGGTLVAHHAATDHERVIPAAPILWALLLMAATVCGSRRGRWRRRGPAEILLTLLGAQIGLHVVMGLAPWAFGLAVPHPPPLVTPAALAAHGLLACVLACLVWRLEHLLGAAQAAARALAGLVRAALARPPAPAPPALAVPAPPARRPAAPAVRRWTARGPPAVVA